MAAEIVEMGRASCIELFESYGVQIQPTAMTPTDSSRCCGIIGFTGDGIRGSVLLAASSEVLQRAYPLEGVPGWDWAGELANQLLGRLKNHLLSRGVTISLTTPMVLRGVEIRPVDNAQLRSEMFVSEAIGTVVVWLDIETEPGFVLGASSAESAGMPEGQSILF